jgi:antitoxin YefM
MKTTSSVTEGQAPHPQLVKPAADSVVTIERHGTVAPVMAGRERLEAIAETLELLANRDFTATLKKYRAGKLKMKPLATSRV